MIDIHPPQHGSMTRRDFFVHLGIVVLGILIAIGLEQSVEYIHHAHERQELRKDLRDENGKALRDNADTLRYTAAYAAWYDQRIASVASAIRQHTPIPNLPPPRDTLRSYPDDPVWRAAKSSNLIEVMPQQDITAYSEIESLINIFANIAHDTAPRSALAGFERQFRVSAQSRDLDLSSASHADLVEELRLLSVVSSQLSTLHTHALYVDGALHAVLNGERNLDRIDDAENNAVAH